jgi:hypothetical protein
MSKFVDFEWNSAVAHQVIHQVSIKVEMNLALQRLVLPKTPADIKTSPDRTI